MRRSNSSSHIPLMRRSKSMTRLPIRKDSTSNISRARSGDRLTANERGSSILSSASKRGFITPVLGTGSHSRLTGRNLVTPTPSTSRARSKSPCSSSAFKATRHTNDKKWISEQYAKVRQYLRDCTDCPQHILDGMKPISINNFVTLVQLFFNQMDAPVALTLANYKEEMVPRLKAMHYPGVITNSFLKSVNTLHEWPHVVNLFSWMVGLILQINGETMTCNEEKENSILQIKECTIDYFNERYVAYNNDESEAPAGETYSSKMKKILNIDDMEIIQIDHEVSQLSALKEDQMRNLDRLEKQISTFQQKIRDLQEEIDNYGVEFNEKKAAVTDEIQQLNQRKTWLDEQIGQVVKSIEDLKLHLENQIWTVEDKLEMLKHVDELKHTIELKKLNYMTRTELKEEMDRKLVESKKKVEEEVYRLNRELMKLVVDFPELKEYELSSTGFTRIEFTDEIKKLINAKENLKTQLEHQENSITSQITKLKDENGNFNKQLTDLENTMQHFKKLIEEINGEIKEQQEEMEKESKDAEREIQAIVNKIRSTIDSKVDLTPLRVELEKLDKKEMETKNNFEIFKNNTVEFFCKIHTEMIENLSSMKMLKNKFCEDLETTLKNISQMQTKILEDLETLRELLK